MATSTTGHESEFVTVGGLKSTLQKYKTNISDTKLAASLKGAANGLAELDSNGKVPASQLPSYVDDIIEGYLYNGKFYKESTHTTEITGEGGKIYTDLATNKTYRWSGSAYTQIKGDLTIGTTAGTAADGKVVADHTGNTTVHITAAERTAWNAKGSYSKPSGGIPKTDLASGVQDSLSLADSALQAADITGKADKNATVSTVAYDTTNKKITKTINGTTSDVVTAAKIVTDGGGLTSHASRKLVVTNGTAAAVSQGTEITFVESVAGASSGSTSDLTATTTRKKVTIPAIPSAATTGADGLMSAADKTKLDGIATGATKVEQSTVSGWGFTKNAGTVTGVKVNGTTKSPSSGIVDIGTVITEHQDISGKADSATTLAGYGITDAKIEGGVITLGANTITPITDISGKQNKVNKLGSVTKPVYTSAAGTFAECSDYAGGTAVTLNGTSKGASTASFYSPTVSGTAGQVLVSGGASTAPSWASVASTEVCEAIIDELS